MAMEDLLKGVMAGLEDDKDIVPKYTKRTSEEETTFVRLDKEKDGSKVRIRDDEVSPQTPVKKARTEVVNKEKEENKPDNPGGGSIHSFRFLTNLFVGRRPKNQYLIYG